MTNVPQDLVFTTPDAPERTDEQRKADELHFEIDGVRYLAIKPSKSVFVRLSLAAARNRSDIDQAAAVIDFLDEAIDPISNAAITARLTDREDRLEYNDLLDLIETMIQHWSNNAPKNGPAAVTKRRRAPQPAAEIES